MLGKETHLLELGGIMNLNYPKKRLYIINLDRLQVGGYSMKLLSPRDVAEVKVVSLAIAVYSQKVGTEAVLPALDSRDSIAGKDRSDVLTRLQVPPRPPKRQSFDCLFFYAFLAYFPGL